MKEKELRLALVCYGGVSLVLYGRDRLPRMIRCKPILVTSMCDAAMRD
jgi:hypothetical protein